ncbi:aromatic ring-opening dioxygenase [Marinomonas sp. S3726]|uniref:dioxygenase family protein n=1 Tax=Marinomonas sp. S3726 TaxID=579484 RepID=UPI0005FA7026|nr:class III extradiol ring-cleavage dioxygenase [Marinomonas sp. S3726]KJZ08670.1 aromatic ring-opening dioxygenase [Marinomonas sp. S3726]
MSLAPVMFISHGSPMYGLAPGIAGQQLNEISGLFDQSSAIVVISPHWMTRGNAITHSREPGILHDFGGFPKALYELTYPAMGQPELAQTIQTLLAQKGVQVHLDPRRSFDHGVWIPLLHLRPEADIPIVQVSLNVDATPEDLVDLGSHLYSLREQGVAIIASGGLTHNLYDIQMKHQKVADYAARFELWVTEQAQKRNLKALQNASVKNPDFKPSHPTPEHYLPLLIAMGATTKEDEFSQLTSPIQHHSISMTSFLWQGTS